MCVCVGGGGGGGGLLKFRFDRRITEAYFKKWFNRFFLCSGMKLEFLFQLELNNNYLYSFGHKEIVDLFV